jgi:hypothetical protein
MDRSLSGQAEALPCPGVGGFLRRKPRRRKMKRLSTYVLASVICLGTTAVLAISSRNVKFNASVEAALASDGAFRDGLYLGKLAAESGQPPRAAIGRWSTDQDRSAFATGYRHGYNESLASERRNSASARSTE